MTLIDGTWTWRQLAPATPPDAREDPAMAWGNGRALMYGGRDSSGPGDLDETVELVADEWAQLFPGTTPGGGQGWKMVRDDVNARFLLYGGTRGGVDLNELWEFPDSTSDWNQLFPANVPPGYNPPTQPGSTGSTSATCWDGARMILLIDIVTGTETWEYVAADFDRVTLAEEFGGPALWVSRHDIALCWAGDRAIGTGGHLGTDQSYNDTNELTSQWDTTVADGTGGMWLHRSRHKIVWKGDEAFQFGGMTATVGTVGEPVSNESWTYDKATSTWADLTAVVAGTPPSARQLFGMVWDGDRVIVFAGRGSGTPPNNETWVLEPAEVPEGAHLNHVFGLGR